MSLSEHFPISPDFSLDEEANTFSPADLISTPKPGVGIANEKGDLAFVPVSQYSSSEKKTTKIIRITPLQSTVDVSKLPSLDPGEVFWLDDRTLGHVIEGKGDNTGVQELWAVPLEYDDVNSLFHIATPSAFVGSFPSTTELQNFKFSTKASVLVFSASTYGDFDLTTVKQLDTHWENRGTSAMVYDGLFTRHWDHWRGPKKQSLFAVELTYTREGKWVLGQEAWSLQKDTGHFTPVEPFGGSEDFDVSATHVIYTTKDPSLDPAWHTRQNIHVVPIKRSDEKLHVVTLTSGSQGATSSPALSHDGKRATWLEMAEDGYEAGKKRIAVYNLEEQSVFYSTDQWDFSPSSVVFSSDDRDIYLVAGENGRDGVWVMGLAPDTASFPVRLTREHSASSPQMLPGGRLLFTQSSFTEPNNLFVLTSSPKSLVKITNFGKEIAEQGKVLDKGEEFWVEGAEPGRQVHSWVLKPKGWKEAKENGERMTKRWPAVLLIHGGPQSAWLDAWSTRWNFNAFSQQGYFVIAPNPSGSTTFGQKFVDAVTKERGGVPFVDLKKAWDYALKTYPEIDPERTVAAGGSFGGYAINWIQSHPEFGFNFKALVCHAGAFDTKYGFYSTDELYFPGHDFGGKPWETEVDENLNKFTPSNFVQNWSVPELITHGSRDYRVIEAHGVATFNALQSRGVESRLVVFPDENHWIASPGNSLKWHYEVFRWFDRFVGRKAGIKDKPLGD